MRRVRNDLIDKGIYNPTVDQVYDFMNNVEYDTGYVPQDLINPMSYIAKPQRKNPRNVKVGGHLQARRIGNPLYRTTFNPADSTFTLRDFGGFGQYIVENKIDKRDIKNYFGIK